MGYFLPVFSLVLLSAVACHATLPAEVYWHTVLPNTPMPSAIKTLLRPDALVDKNIENTGTAVTVGKDRVYVNVNTGYGRSSRGTSNNIRDRYASHHLYFLEKDLLVDAKMNLDFTSPRGATTFLPKRAADSIPFSQEKAEEILGRFSIEANSPEADAMKQTLKDCEEPESDGEQQVCATSLESMVDFSIASLKTHNLMVASTTTDKEQEYTITPAGVQRMAGSESVACHLMPYAYAMFYCHKTYKTIAYKVEMVGENGDKVETVAMCHTDTARWNPEHYAFKMLKVKPGTVPVCHFMTQDAVVWTR